MLDRLVLHLPIKQIYVEVDNENYFYLVDVDLLELGLKVGSWDVYKTDDGYVRHACLNHAWERIPTSHTKMSFKLFHEGRIWPHFELKASPAKVLQGHNVYGTDDIYEGACEMLGSLIEAMPQLAEYIDFRKIEVNSLDVTYSARLKDEHEVSQVLEYLRNVTNKQVRKTTDKSQVTYGNTVYWGSRKTRRLARKAYGKYCEVLDSIKDLEKEVKKGDKHAQLVYRVLTDPDLLLFARGLLRFETTVKAYYLKEHGLPTNLWELIKHQQENPEFLKHIWQKANDPIFEALQGEMMTDVSFNQISKMIQDKFVTYTPTGKLSKAKANRLIQFYCGLEQVGFTGMKKLISESRFYDNVRDLQLAGISKAHLQNLLLDNTNVIPFVKKVYIDFDKQLPNGYIHPVSRYNLSKIA